MITRQTLAPAFAELVALMKSGASAYAVAAFINAHKYNVALSHEIENAADDGTFAALVFDILCGEA